MLCGLNREDVVQAALTVERWCEKTNCRECPFEYGCYSCFFPIQPKDLRLEEFLRTRGLRDEKQNQ